MPMKQNMIELMHMQAFGLHKRYERYKFKLHKSNDVKHNK